MSRGGWLMLGLLAGGCGPKTAPSTALPGAEAEPATVPADPSDPGVAEGPGDAGSTPDRPSSADLPTLTAPVAGLGACADLLGRWESTTPQPCGLDPAGAEASCRWTLTLEPGVYSARWSDMLIRGTWSCVEAGARLHAPGGMDDPSTLVVRSEEGTVRLGAVVYRPASRTADPASPTP